MNFIPLEKFVKIWKEKKNQVNLLILIIYKDSRSSGSLIASDEGVTTKFDGFKRNDNLHVFEASLTLKLCFVIN